MQQIGIRMTPQAPTDAAKAFIRTLEQLFDEHHEAVAIQDCDFEAGRHTVDLQTETLHLETGDTGTEVTLERIVDGIKVPANFDIDTVVLIDETETLVSTTFYVLNTGKVEVHVAYSGFLIDGCPLEMYSGQAGARILEAALPKLKRAVALFPDGVSPRKPGNKRRRTPATPARVMIDDK